MSIVSLCSTFCVAWRGRAQCLPARPDIERDLLHRLVHYVLRVFGFRFCLPDLIVTSEAFKQRDCDQLTIGGYFAGALEQPSIVFASGTVWTASNIATRLGTVTDIDTSAGGNLLMGQHRA
nr:calcium-binding protein [Paraburkholderia heleia]